MLPVLALFHLLHEFGPDHFSAARDVATGFGAQVESFHQLVVAGCGRIVERAVKGRWANERLQFARRNTTPMNDQHGLQAGAVEHLQARVEVEELRCVLVVDVELEKVMRQLAVMDGVIRRRE